MSNAQCPDAEALSVLLEIDKPLPQELIRHAANCRNCLFWIPYCLALQEIYKTTHRVKMDDRCPDRECFRGFLLTTVQKIRRAIKLSAGPGLEEFMKMSEGDSRGTAEIIEHITRCSPCADFLETLRLQIPILRAKYSMAIQAGETIRATIETSGKEWNYVEIRHRMNWRQVNTRLN